MKQKITKKQRRKIKQQTPKRKCGNLASRNHKQLQKNSTLKINCRAMMGHHVVVSQYFIQKSSPRSPKGSKRVHRCVLLDQHALESYPITTMGTQTPFSLHRCNNRRNTEIQNEKEQEINLHIQQQWKNKRESRKRSATRKQKAELNDQCVSQIFV